MPDCSLCPCPGSWHDAFGCRVPGHHRDADHPLPPPVPPPAQPPEKPMPSTPAPIPVSGPFDVSPVYAAAKAVWAPLKDGFQWRKDIPALLGTVDQVMAAAETVYGLTGPGKRQAVIDALDAAIDIPWVPDVIERKVFALVVGSICDVVAKASKGLVAVNQ